MNSSSVITTGLASDLIDWLGSYAKGKKMTRRAILEKAIKDYRFKMRREEVEKSFEQIAEGPEVLELAEMGIEDYENQLKLMEI